MGCSFPGLTAIIVVGVAAVLNIVSYSLPMWSTSTLVQSDGGAEISADFTAGIWGYCTDVSISNKTDVSQDSAFDHCFLFHTSSKFDQDKLKKIDSDLVAKLSGNSVCGGYDKASAIGAVGRKAFATALALVAEIDATAFQAFLDKSCGFLGTLEIIVATVAMLTGVAAFVLLVLGVTFFKEQSTFNGFVKILVVITFVFEALTAIYWLIQAHPINKLDTVSLSGSFILSVISSLMFLVSIELVQRHLYAHAGYMAL